MAKETLQATMGEKKDSSASKNVPFKEQILYPNSILQTDNIGEVRNVIECLLAQQDCQSID